MKTFELKSQNKKAFIIILLIIAVIILLVAMNYGPWFIRNGYGGYGVIAIGVVLVGGSVLFRKILAKKYIIAISEKEIQISQKGILKAASYLDQIAMLKLRSNVNVDELTIYTTGEKKVLMKFDTVNQNKAVMDIINELHNHIEFVQHIQNDRFNNAYTEYINKNIAQSRPQAIQELRQAQGSSKKKLSAVVVGIFFLATGLMFIPFFVNPKAFYDNKDGKIYFGSTELVGVKPEESRTLSYHVLKDSSHIYYKDQILEWADRETFKCMREPFYMDKNGVYYETSNYFVKNKIVPLEGEYDKATFRMLGEYSSLFFKDKNNLYHIDIQIVGDGNKSPLKKVEVAGLDIASFELLNSSWYADKDKVYFNQWDELQPCPEIDRASFEILAWAVAKDKNNVYYLTYNLKSEHKKSTGNKNYAILEGADAPTFEMINDRDFFDKNTTWIIRTEGEEINMREDMRCK